MRLGDQIREVKPLSFIYAVERALPADVCLEAVRRFEAHAEQQVAGRIGQAGVEAPEVKRSTDLRISGREDWRDIDRTLSQQLVATFNAFAREFPFFAANSFKDIGYNLQRKIVLLSVWALSPLPLYFDPTLFGIFEPHKNAEEFVRHVALIWLFLGVAGLLFRTVHLFFIQDVQTGLVWMTKILTDPFHDIKLYYKAPMYLLRGELIDPRHAQHHDDEELEEQPRTA